MGEGVGGQRGDDGAESGFGDVRERCGKRMGKGVGCTRVPQHTGPGRLSADDSLQVGTRLWDSRPRADKCNTACPNGQ